jgi:hypothetical protein
MDEDEMVVASGMHGGDEKCTQNFMMNTSWLTAAKIPHYLLTYYLFTLWCTILFEKLITLSLSKDIRLAYGTRRFIIVFTKARHWTLF